MAACGKLGAGVVLLNTGFAKPQFADVCERENVKAVLHDSEFVGLLDALPDSPNGARRVHLSPPAMMSPG